MLVNLQFFLRINEPILIGIHHLEQKIDLVIVGVLQVGDLLHRLDQDNSVNPRWMQHPESNKDTSCYKYFPNRCF